MIAPRLLSAPAYSCDEAEAQSAFDRWGCNCGPSALATMLGLKPDDIRAQLPGFDDKRYTNPTMMYQALDALGVLYRALPVNEVKFEGQFVTNGLVRIQWDGPWCDPGVPIRARYRQTHWIGALQHAGQTKVFDVNGGWMDAQRWVKDIVPMITANVKRATGKWWSTHRLNFIQVVSRAVPK